VHALLTQRTAPTSGLEPNFIVELFRAVLGDLSLSPWLVGFFALMVLNAMVRTVRAVVHGRHSKDPQRRFSRRERAEIFARAGDRCEQHSWLFGRCGVSEGLQADHIHPHSRGGATVIENGQALCRRHNKQKSARVPWNWELARLARRREVYFPAGAPRAVVRHRGTARADPNG
jgi:5-methylcytosine-specific restriction endonuclease McrA